MSLLTYEQTRPWARSIKERVSTRKMPPWFIDKKIGVRGFKEDKSLSDDEIATIVRWVDSGAPRGNPADMPPPRDFARLYEWQVGEPDWIVSIPEPYVVAPEAPDWFGRLESPTGLTEDRWIKSVETKPSAEGFAVTHHAVTNIFDPESGERSFLNEYAIGKNGDIFPDGTGREIKAGSTIQFNMHYHAIGEEATDRTSVGLTFYPRGAEPRKKLLSRAVGWNVDLDIPAGESNVRHDGYHRLERKRENHRVPATSAQSGKTAVSRSDLARQPRRDTELRRLGLRMAHRLQLQGRRGAVASQGDHAARHQLARQLGGEPLE